MANPDPEVYPINAQNNQTENAGRSGFFVKNIVSFRGQREAKQMQHWQRQKRRSHGKPALTGIHPGGLQRADEESGEMTFPVSVNTDRGCSP